MSSIHRVATVLLVSLAALGLAACGDSDDVEDATPTPTGTGTSFSPSATPTASASTQPSPSPTGSPTVQKYEDPRFGYSIELPASWRPATMFMDAFANTKARYQAGGNSEDYAVMTGMTVEDESQAVDSAVANRDWLAFLLRDTVVIFPTTYDRVAQLTSANEGSVQYLVSDEQDITLANGLTGTRYTVELLNDEDHFVYDRVFVEAVVPGCPTCKGFILETAVAGVSFLHSTTGFDPVPGVYPLDQFEAIFRSFLTAS